MEQGNRRRLSRRQDEDRIAQQRRAWMESVSRSAIRLTSEQGLRRACDYITSAHDIYSGPKARDSNLTAPSSASSVRFNPHSVFYSPFFLYHHLSRMSVQNLNTFGEHSSFCEPSALRLSIALFADHLSFPSTNRSLRRRGRPSWQHPGRWISGELHPYPHSAAERSQDPDDTSGPSQRFVPPYL